MGYRPTKSLLFVLGGLVVLAVVLSLYLGKSQPGQIPAVPDPADDPHTEIVMLEEMWKAHPTHAPIALQLGNLLATEGQHARAIEYYREFLKLDTSATGWEVHLDVARSFYALGRMTEAKAEVQWILQREPDHAGALYNLGAIEANTGNSQVARDYWERLIAKHPEDTLARFARAALGQLK